MESIHEIPIKYDRFPAGYVNDVRGWAFDRETITKCSGQLLTLDMDFGSRCSLNCPYCFRRSNSVDVSGRTMSFEDSVNLIDEAKSLGLRSVKFLGAGEPLENPRFLDFLRKLAANDIIPVVFSKTGILGDDRSARALYAKDGISSSLDLAKCLYDLGASVVLGFNAFDAGVQSQMVGNGRDYMAKRDRALLNLVEAGFADGNPTRLALGVNPVTVLNIQEAASVYEWARPRNMYAIVTPTMISGRAKGDAWRLMAPATDSLLELYTRIYNFNISVGLQTPQQLEADGISPYAGGHPCNQVAAGLYVTLSGIVLSCPGSEELVEGNYWERSLEHIWIHSCNQSRVGTFNCGCVAKDGKSIPDRFYDAVRCELGRFTGSCASSEALHKEK